MIIIIWIGIDSITKYVNNPIYSTIRNHTTLSNKNIKECKVRECKQSCLWKFDPNVIYVSRYQAHRHEQGLSTIVIDFRVRSTSYTQSPTLGALTPEDIPILLTKNPSFTPMCFSQPRVSHTIYRTLGAHTQGYPNPSHNEPEFQPLCFTLSMLSH